ncbi:hypothetical protein EUX98_g7893 [Antrodiella citrinella]|uniref:DUF6699 domain-containing protein n=1 Tax=Antrodiella citrinella TaxID=2447956 RepID=A0A4S4MSH3_9APHY|nr:hypothetical protein EUX98_g7893 [Antrodiella citrinella]
MPKPQVVSSGHYAYNVPGTSVPAFMVSTPYQFPATPSYMPYGMTPQKPINVHRSRVSPVELCPWLIPNPADINMPHIKWDMSLPPTTAKRMSGTGIVTSLTDKFSDGATDPPVRHIEIIIPAGPEEPMGVGALWSNIIIKQDKSITTADIFWAIYDFLHTPLLDHEIEDVKKKLEIARQYSGFPYETLEHARKERGRVSLDISDTSDEEHPQGCYCHRCKHMRHVRIIQPTLKRNEQRDSPSWWTPKKPPRRPSFATSRYVQTPLEDRRRPDSKQDQAIRSHPDSHWSSAGEQFVQRMVRQMMPYEAHPMTGRHPCISMNSADMRAIYAITGGWPLPGRAPSNFRFKWPRKPIPGVPVLLAPTLVVNPFSNSRPLIDWDMSTDPSTATKVSYHGGIFSHNLLDPATLSAPATQPPCSHMTIVASIGSFGSLWSPIRIQKRVVTVQDVLVAVHTFLNTALTDYEVNNIIQIQEGMNLPPNLRLAAFARDRIRRADITTRPKLYCRADCLGVWRWFSGMWFAYTADGHWYLNLGVREKYDYRRPAVHFLSDTSESD